MWTSAASSFAWDGSLRDIVIHDCSADDWPILFSALSELDGTQVILPTGRENFWSDPTSVFSEYSGKSIMVRRGGIDLKCDIISPDVIEFDLDPRQIRDQPSLDTLLQAMRTMSSALSKVVSLTEEGDHNDVLIRVEPS